MGLTAYLFPGQGSQSVGMGKELWANRPEATAVFERADGLLGRSLSSLMFDGPEDALKETANTQPALFVCSLAALQCLRSEIGVDPAFMAGHSLGEFSALTASGVFSFEDGLKLVQIRANAMSRTAKASPGSMAAILKLSDADVEAACEQARSAGPVQPANYNCPGQLVISGSQAGVDKAVELCKAIGGKALMLPVSGAFHSEAMRPAGEALKAALLQAAWSEQKVPVIANVDATVSASSAETRAKLVAQVSGAVRWTQSVLALRDKGVTRFVEIGPGRVLAGLVKKILPEAEVFNVSDLASLAVTVAALKG